jgi:hypothetical protein
LYEDLVLIGSRIVGGRYSAHNKAYNTAWTQPD